MSYKQRLREKRREEFERQRYSIPMWCHIRFEPEVTGSKRSVHEERDRLYYEATEMPLPDVPQTPMRLLVPGIENYIVTAALKSAKHDTAIFANGAIDFYVKGYRKYRLGAASPSRIVYLYIWRHLDPLSIVDTVAHELRHIAQFHRGLFYEPHKSPDLNWDEPLEEDARDFAAAVVAEVAADWKGSDYKPSHYVWVDRIVEKGEPVWVVKRGLIGTIIKGSRFTLYDDAFTFMRKYLYKPPRRIPAT